LEAGDRAVGAGLPALYNPLDCNSAQRWQAGAYGSWRATAATAGGW